jgi:uncharacterized protein (TIGR03067 family)
VILVLGLMRTKLLLFAVTMSLAAAASAQTSSTPPPPGVAQIPAQPAAAGKPAAGMSKIMADLQGSWVFTTANGNDTTGQPEIVITLTDNKYVQTVNGEVVERGSFKIDETKKPICVDLSIAEGNDAGKSQLGVMELSGGVLKAKMADAGETTRPTDFAPADGAFVFTAVKKK